MPPSRACAVCKNSMTDRCLEKCAPQGSYQYFEPDLKIAWERMPDLSWHEYMALKNGMRGHWLFVNLIKAKEAIQGYQTGQKFILRQKSPSI